MDFLISNFKSMAEFTDVHFEWSDGEQTVESFLKEREVFRYIETIHEDSAIRCNMYQSDNPEWLF